MKSLPREELVATPDTPVRRIWPLKRFPVFLDLHDRRDNTPLHQQKGIEINLTNEGAGTMQVGDQRFSLAPRQVVIFYADQPHAFRAKVSGGYMRSILCLDPDHAPVFRQTKAVENILNGGIHTVRLESSDYMEADQLMCRLRIELVGRPPEWEAMSVALAWTFLLRLLRMPSSTSDCAFDGGSADLVREVIAHIQTHLDSPLKLNDVADRFDISQEHLTRSFTRHTGLSFHKFVNSERIGKAESILRNRSDVSLIDVALMVGFNSASSFSRAFRAIKQMSPSDYRKSIDFT